MRHNWGKSVQIMLSRMSDKIQVQKQNSLVDAIYRLSLNESRLLNWSIARTDYKTHCYDNIIFFTVTELKNFYSLTTKNSYDEFKKALDELYERRITYYDHDNKGYRTCRIITDKFDDKGSRLGLKFSEQISDLIATNKNFLTYKLKNTVKITSPTAIRIYEILLNRLKKNHSRFQVNIDELKKILGFEKTEYAKYSDFKRRVLEVAKKQINAHTDISFDYDVEKYGGRSVIDLIFVSKFKHNNDLKKESTENTDNNDQSNNKLQTDINNPFGTKDDIVDISDDDRKFYIKSDLKEYIGIDDFMINKYIKDYSDKLHILEEQILHTLDADADKKIKKNKASHFSHYLKYKG
jgi:plasmid replication initiation protein